MFFLRLLWHCVWFLQVGLHVVLSLVLIERRSYRQFPIFVSYVTWKALNGGVLLAMNYAPFITGNEYTAAFAVARAIDAALAFAIISEILKHLMSSYSALRKLGVALFRWATIVLLVVVVALAWFAPAAGEGHLMSGFFVLERTVDALLCGLLLLLFGLPRLVGFSWRSQAFGIALGLGILATVSLATSAIRSQIEPIARNQTFETMELLNQGTYLCSVLVWMAYVFMPKPAPRTPLKTLPEHNLETWNQELQRLLHQ
jgi:hypothetical protein